MSEEIIKELQKVSQDLVRLDSRVDNLQQTIQTELKPLNKLFQGNGKPSLEARIYHVEHEVEEQSNVTGWALKTALCAAVSAIGTIVWSMIKD